MATNLTGTKRQSYTVSDKLRIINFAEQHGNRTAEWEFGVSENNVRLWRRTKENLEKMPRLKTDPFRTILFVCSLDFLFPFVYFFSGNHSPKIARVCIIHGRALYTGKYGKLHQLQQLFCNLSWNVLFSVVLQVAREIAQCIHHLSLLYHQPPHKSWFLFLSGWR